MKNLVKLSPDQLLNLWRELTQADQSFFYNQASQKGNMTPRVAYDTQRELEDAIHAILYPVAVEPLVPPPAVLSPTSETKHREYTLTEIDACVGETVTVIFTSETDHETGCTVKGQLERLPGTMFRVGKVDCAIRFCVRQVVGIDVGDTQTVYDATFYVKL